MTTVPLRGRWAQGLPPRFFCWIIKERLAGSERPGGFARNHRKVRRQEELIWLRQHSFSHVLSLLDSPHNLQAYDDAGLAYAHVPLGRHDELVDRLGDIYATLDGWLADPAERVLVHHEEFGDRLLGTLGGYLFHAGFVDAGTEAIVLVEHLANRQLGAVGREIIGVTVSAGLHSPPGAGPPGP